MPECPQRRNPFRWLAPPLDVDRATGGRNFWILIGRHQSMEPIWRHNGIVVRISKYFALGRSGTSMPGPMQTRSALVYVANRLAAITVKLLNYLSCFISGAVVYHDQLIGIGR